MPNRIPLPEFRSPTAVSMPPDLHPFTHHLHLDDSGYASWDAKRDVAIRRLGCLGEQPETKLEFRIEGRVVAEFSTLHLSLLWPGTFEAAQAGQAILVDRRETLELRGPIRAIVLLVGVWR